MTLDLPQRTGRVRPPPRHSDRATPHPDARLALHAPHTFHALHLPLARCGERRHALAGQHRRATEHEPGRRTRARRRLTGAPKRLCVHAGAAGRVSDCGARPGLPRRIKRRCRDVQAPIKRRSSAVQAPIKPGARRLRRAAAPSRRRRPCPPRPPLRRLRACARTRRALARR